MHVSPNSSVATVAPNAFQESELGLASGLWLLLPLDASCSLLPGAEARALRWGLYRVCLKVDEEASLFKSG